ncbi:hypothetical protein [Tenacibaculum aiptasiae]|nr:hypothetical protein [Tenacibaculum aiptasiae]
MKNSILNLGKVLNKTEQKNVNGGAPLCSQDICDIWDSLIFKPFCVCYQ